MNKKGFSLIELLVAIAILGILAALLTPSLHHLAVSSKEKTDRAAVLTLGTTIQAASQHNSIYKDAKQVADGALNNQITLIYTVNEDNMLVFNRCEITNTGNMVITDSSPGTAKDELVEFRDKVTAYVNGKVEPITFQSELYRGQDYKFILTFPDVDFKVNMEMEMISAAED